MKSSEKRVPHIGFDSETTQKSSYVCKVYCDTLKVIEEKISVATSTPLCNRIAHKDIMNISFTKCFEDSSKCQNNSFSVIDNDSGYISTNHESNSTFPMESTDSCNDSLQMLPVYFSEDALLEKPQLPNNSSKLDEANDENNEESEEYSHLFYLSDCSVIPSSLNSTKTHFSGFEDDISVLNESATQSSVITNSFSSTKTCFSGLEDNSVSDKSAEISVQSPIIAKVFQAITGNNDNSAECSQKGECDFNDTISDNSQISEATQKADVLINDKELGDLYYEDIHAKTPTKTYINPINPDISPELFSDEEEIDDNTQQKGISNAFAAEKYVNKRDRRLISKVNAALSGVLPPPSFTVVHLSAEEILNKINSNKHLFWCDSSLKSEENPTKSVASEERKSLLVNGDKESCIKKEWPCIMDSRYHGLHHNRSKLSEEFEQLCIKYAQRYVGMETQSTCTVFETSFSSPSKRKSTKLRWNVKSPGRRLSHLARRRITFNNSVLQTSSSTVCSRAKQILVDARRLELLSRKKSPKKKSPSKRTPRKSPRKTPRKSPRKVRTPSSSSKKRLARQFRMYSDSEESIPSTSSSSSFRASVTKRALFQSPDHSSSCSSLAPSTSGLSFASTNLKRNTPKRALFSSPEKSSPSKMGSMFDRKRKRNDSENLENAKIARSMSMEVRPSGSEMQKLAVQRPQSECGGSLARGVELSAHHKKKLQWAVYEALKSRNIGPAHPQFKTFASVLARVTRRFLPNLSGNSPRPEGGTSERMLKIARQHVSAAIQGKSVDEIIQNAESNNLKLKKPMGYVSAEDVFKADVAHVRNKENILQDKSNILNSMEKKNREDFSKSKFNRAEKPVDRIRKVINFGDEINVGSVR